MIKKQKTILMEDRFLFIRKHVSYDYAVNPLTLLAKRDL